MGQTQSSYSQINLHQPLEHLRLRAIFFIETSHFFFISDKLFFVIRSAFLLAVLAHVISMASLFIEN